MHYTLLDYHYFGEDGKGFKIMMTFEPLLVTFLDNNTFLISNDQSWKIKEIDYRSLSTVNYILLTVLVLMIAAFIRV